MTNIKKDLLNGIFWSAIEKYSVLVVSIVVSMVLARLISPDDFGAVTIATIIISFLAIFSTMGIGPAIIQKKDLSSNDINSIFSFSTFLAFIFSLLFFASSNVISSFFENPKLIPVCRILSIHIFFSTLNMVPSALMAKNKRFKEIAKITVTIQILVGLVAVYAAWNGIGIYALLIAPIVTSISIFFVNKFYYPVKFIFPPDYKAIKKIFSYSFFQFCFEFVNFFSRNLDKLIIGKIISSESLGYYDKAYRLMQLPATQLTGVITPVLQPVMTSLQDNMSEMALKYNKIIAIIGAISFPLSIYLYCSGPEIIPIFFGDNWDNAIKPFQILSISLATQMILSTSGGIWQSCNATKYLFIVGLLNSSITTIGFIIGACLGKTIEFIAAAWTTTSIINFFTTYLIMYKKILMANFFSMLKGLALPTLNSLILLIIMFFFKQYSYELHPLVLLIVKTLTFAFITFAFFYYQKKKLGI